MYVYRQVIRWCIYIGKWYDDIYIWVSRMVLQHIYRGEWYDVATCIYDTYIYMSDTVLQHVYTGELHGAVYMFRSVIRWYTHVGEWYTVLQHIYTGEWHGAATRHSHETQRGDRRCQRQQPATQGGQCRVCEHTYDTMQWNTSDFLTAYLYVEPETRTGLPRRHASPMCVTWLICLCDKRRASYSSTRRQHTTQRDMTFYMCAMTHMCAATLVGQAWKARTTQCDMTYSYVCHDSCVCGNSR